MALRKAAGLSQVQLADRLGVGQSYVSKIERGEAYVDVLVFIDWCEACGARAVNVIDGFAQSSSQSDPEKHW